MPKKIIEDMKIKRVRSSDSLPRKKVEVKPIPNEVIVEPKKIKDMPIHVEKKIRTRRISNGPNFREKPKKSRSIINILFVVTLFTGFIFWGSVVFENVNIVVTKKHQLFNLENKELVASKESASVIPFEIMIISDKKFQEITLSKSEEVSLKAKGEVTLYNEYSKKSEKLSAETYLSDEDGKVYLTNKVVSIPGYTLEKNKVIPGEISVEVTSFLPGEVYNGNPVDFYINSFNGTSKYKKIYGKAKTVFAGGAQGLNYSLDEKNMASLDLIAKSSFKSDLLKKVNSLIPKEYIFYPSASIFSFQIEEGLMSPVKSIEVEISGTLSVVLLKRMDLINSLKKELLPEISSEELLFVNIIGTEDLIFNFTQKDQDISKDLNSTKFTLTGELDFVWEPKIIELKNKLTGASRESLVSIFEEDPGIGDAFVKIFPPWKKTLPLNQNKLEISVF